MKKFLTSVVFHSFLAVLRVLPSKLKNKLAESLGVLYFKISPRHLDLMVSNMRLAFKDEYTREELEGIALRSQQNLFKCAFEFARFPYYTDEEIINMVRVEGAENLELALKDGKGATFASAHFGNWELLGARIVRMGYSLTGVGRDQNEGLLNDFILKRRIGKGTKSVPRGAPLYDHIVGLLANNELIALVSDQNAGPRGLFVDFFGSKVSAFKGPGMFAVRTGSKVVPAFIVREGYEKHVAYFMPHVEIEKSGDAGKDVLAYTQGYVSFLEDFVRRYPDQWFWIHKRWKTRPPGEENGDN